MSLNLLLAQFDQVIQTPTDTVKLQTAILNWAVRGHLKTQDPNDDPIDKLVERITAQRRAMVNANGHAKPKKLTPINPVEVPYETPKNWRWVRLPAIYHTYGQIKPKETFTYIDVSSIDNERGVIGRDLQVIEAKNAPSRARKLVAPGTVIYSTVRPYLLNIAIVEQEYDPPPIVSTAFAVMHPFTGVGNKYLYYYLRSRPFIDFVEDQMTGMAYPAISDSKMNKGLIPLPPYKEQLRIVNKVDELFAETRELAGRLESADTQRKKFHTAAIHRLTEAKTPKETGAAWQLIRDNFDMLYREPETIDELKQAILQLAVMGRLVPQDPDDEPASILLEKASLEKDRLLHNGSIRRSQKLNSIGQTEEPFSLPFGWSWSKVGQVTDLISGKGFKLREYTDSGLKLFQIANVSFGQTKWETINYLPYEYVENYPQLVLKPNDLLIALNRPLLKGKMKVAILSDSDMPSILYQRVGKFIIFDSGILTRYFFYYLQSPLFIEQLQEGLWGSDQPFINKSKLVQFLIPIPPTSEQRRIVNMLDELFELCEILADQALLYEESRKKLLDVLLLGRLNDKQRS